MICSYGMSDRLGPVSLSDDDHDVFLGRDLMSHKSYSEKKAQEIDDEITEVLKTLYDEAYQMLQENRDVLERITLSLLERETLETKELALLLAGEELPPVVPPPTPNPPAEQADEEESKPFSGEKLPDPEPVPG